jgi:hypothetical protein
MSRGAGRIEREIRAAFAADPDNAFTTDELVWIAFPGVFPIEKKHRVSVLRAAKKLVARGDGLDFERRWGQGGELVFFNRYNVMSYGMSCLKPNRYHCDDELRARLKPGGRDHDAVAEGGAWWKRVRRWIAERDGDSELVAQMKAEEKAASARTTQRIAAMFAGAVGKKFA